MRSPGWALRVRQPPLPGVGGFSRALGKNAQKFRERDKAEATAAERQAEVERQAREIERERTAAEQARIEAAQGRHRLETQSGRAAK